VQPWPNRFVAQESDNERQRQLLNGMIQAYVASPANARRAAAGGPAVHTLTLPAAWFGFWDMPASRVAQMQDDKLHLTAQGYSMLGQLIAHSILSRLSPQQCLCPAACAGSPGSSRGGR
jgi:lysophospholipase L1-like esterase